MDSSGSISKRLDLRFLASIAITGAIVATFLLLGRASAVYLDIQCPDAPVPQGTQLQCEVELTIREGKRIPIESLQIGVEGPTPLQAVFGPFGEIFNCTVSA